MAPDTNKKGASKRVKIASGPKPLAKRPFRPIDSIKLETRKGNGDRVASFLIKVIALETVRRVSRAKWPFLWNTLQGLQVLCYPPLKWIQCWNPFGLFIKGMQSISQPLLVLSIVNTFSDRSDYSNILSHEPENSPVNREPQSGSESLSELPSCYDQGTRIDDGNPQSVVPTDWVNHIFSELENQGFTLPERITLEQLHRYYIAANGDTSTVLSSIKKTIRWRETYRFLSSGELEVWSNLMFWHGLDVKNRPCLFVRVGLACITLSGPDRALFAQAMVSQVEYGILHLLEGENPQITVLLDCQGLSPLRFPMQMMRHCSTIFKDHFPNVLGCLIVIRAPQVVRVIAHTFINVLKPSTKQRVRMEGEAYQKLLSECFQTLPSYLGGKCTCRRCLVLDSGRFPQNVEGQNLELSPDSISIENIPAVQPPSEYEMIMDNHCSRVLRELVMGILVLMVLIVLMEGIYNPESRPF